MEHETVAWPGKRRLASHARRSPDPRPPAERHAYGIPADRGSSIRAYDRSRLARGMSSIRVAILDLSLGGTLAAGLEDGAFGASTTVEYDAYRCRSIMDVGPSPENLDGPDAVLVATETAGPDFWQTLDLMREHAPNAAMVALDGTGHDISTSCLRAGVDDVVTMEDFRSPAAVRAIERAVERNRYRRRIREYHFGPSSDGDGNEWDSVSTLYAATPLAVTERSFGALGLAAKMPDEYERIVRQYAEFLDRMLAHQTYRGNQPLSEDVNVFADKLGVLGASPRDIVELHKAAMQRKVDQQSPLKGKAYVEEGRFLVLQVMGYLAAFYRRLSWGRAAGLAGTSTGKTSRHHGQSKKELRK